MGRKLGVMSLLPLMLAMSRSNEFDDVLFGKDKFSGEPREKKNKYGLTEDHLEMMKTMTPKEKKKFLKGLK